MAVKQGKARKTGLDPVSEIKLLSVDSIRPSPENDTLYKPIDENDPEILKLRDSIKKNDILEPLVISQDGYILSGHRRFFAGKLAGLTMFPCRIAPVSRADNLDEFVRLLREHNRQRDKTLDEKLREEVVSVSPEDAMAQLWLYRREKAAIDVKPIDIRGRKERSAITKAKLPMLEAILRVLEEYRDYWPLSDRRVHYYLLNDPPLKHASKPRSRYKNDKKSYKALVELLTRARIVGRISMEAIADETRPVILCNAFADARGFIGDQVKDMFRNYWRNLMQSQPNHIEIIGEKNTVGSIIEPVARDYTIPMTTGRGFCSLPPRNEMAERFRKSGKEKLVLLIVSDHDPDGDEIAHSFARSMRDDFEIEQVHPIKVALNPAQVTRFALPPNMEAKKTSSNYKRFVAKYGPQAYELEALQPADLQTILREAIEAVIDQDAYSAEIKAERQDAQFIAEIRQRVLVAMRGLNLADDLDDDVDDEGEDEDIEEDWDDEE